MTMIGQADNRDGAIALVAEVLRSGHKIRIRAQGGSMIPTLWPGDILTIAPISEQSLLPQVGAIVLTHSPGGFRAHRVVAHRIVDGANTIITRGDALASIDPAVEMNAILGTVIGRNGVSLDARQNRSRQLIERALVASPRMQTFALKLNTLRNRGGRLGAGNQFA